MRIIVTVIMLLVIGATCEKASDNPPDDVVAVKGRLTTEGAECPALRAQDGQLYTLAGPTGEFRVGDQVCVKGRRVETSHCMQGITITVEWIGLARWCP